MKGTVAKAKVMESLTGRLCRPIEVAGSVSPGTQDEDPLKQNPA